MACLRNCVQALMAVVFRDMPCVRGNAHYIQVAQVSMLITSACPDVARSARVTLT